MADFEMDIISWQKESSQLHHKWNNFQSFAIDVTKSLIQDGQEVFLPIEGSAFQGLLFERFRLPIASQMNPT